MPDTQKDNIPERKTFQEIIYIKEKMIEMLFWIFSIFIWVKIPFVRNFIPYNSDFFEKS